MKRLTLMTLSLGLLSQATAAPMAVQFKGSLTTLDVQSRNGHAFLDVAALNRAFKLTLNAKILPGAVTLNGRTYADANVIAGALKLSVTVQPGSVVFRAASSSTPAARPNTVSGRILDARNAPVQGVQLLIQPSMFKGVITTTSDAQGRYQSIELNPAANPYEVSAYKEVTYHGRHYCIRMAGDPEPYREAFNARSGAVRNFRFRIQGVSDRPGDSYGAGFWGGTLAMENTYTDDRFLDRSAQIQLTLQPVGPLIDGSPGSTITRTQRFGQPVEDIPVGYYRLTAQLVTSGQKTPLLVSLNNRSSGLGESVDLLFDGFDSCGHSGTFSETHFWLARPGSTDQNQDD